MTKGARVMLSTPPASTRSAWPERMARAACPTASRPEAQSRLTVTPGTLSGNPASSSRHARDIAIVLARLVGAAQDHFVDAALGSSLAMPRHQRPQGQRRQIVGRILAKAPS